MTSRIHDFSALLCSGVLLLCLLAGAGVVRAETNAVPVSGTVKDPSGAVIPGATVTIYNPVTGFDRTASTDASGGFTFTNVPFNPYHLTVDRHRVSPRTCRTWTLTRRCPST